MDALAKLQLLLDERGWSEYKLARQCGLSDPTIANIFRRNTLPTINIKKCCRLDDTRSSRRQHFLLSVL